MQQICCIDCGACNRSVASQAGPEVPLRVMQVLHQGSGSGSVTSTLHLSIGLAARGVHIRFVCPPDSPVEALAREAGLEVHPLTLAPQARRENARKLGDIMRRAPVDLVNSQSARDRAALALLALTGRLPVPAIFTRRQMPLSFWLDNWLAGKAATRVIAVSRSVAGALRRRGIPARKLVVVHNGLVEARVDAVVTGTDRDRWRRLISWSEDRPTIGIVSRPKDQGVVLKALKLIERPLRLVLAGAAGHAQLERMAAETPARHQVILLPFDPQVRPLYDMLDLALLPSRMEGLSQALLEAMALGKAVIASDATSNPEVVRNGENGLLVPQSDPAAWANAITGMLDDPEHARRLGTAAMHTARVEFSMEKTVAGTLRVYEQVKGERVKGEV